MGDARKLGVILAASLGVMATAACWLWLVMLLGAVSMGAPLRAEWQNWMIVIFYGVMPAALASASIAIMIQRRAASEMLLFALAPLGFLAIGPTASSMALWPIT
jgi:hypothetical protein